MYSFFYTQTKHTSIYRQTNTSNKHKQRQKTEKYIILIYFYTYQHLIMPCILTKVDYYLYFHDGYISSKICKYIKKKRKKNFIVAP